MDVLLGSGPQVDQERGIAPVVQDHVGGPFREVEDAVGVGPVFLQALSLVGIDGGSACGDGRGGMILGAIDVAGSPADLRPERLQRLDEHGGLDGHVEAAGNAGALQGLVLGIFLPDGHEAGHLGLGDGNFPAAPVGEGKIGDAVGLLGRGAHGVLLGIKGGGCRGVSPESEPAGLVR